jgi:hypothetical protein
VDLIIDLINALIYTDNVLITRDRKHVLTIVPSKSVCERIEECEHVIIIHHNDNNTKQQ